MSIHPFNEPSAHGDAGGWSPFDALPDAVAVLDDREQVRFTNGAWNELLGASALDALVELAAPLFGRGAERSNGPLRALLAGELTASRSASASR